YTLFLKYTHKQQTIIPPHQFYKPNKPLLTLKQLHFPIPQTLINNKNLYNPQFNKPQIKITLHPNNYTIHLTKNLE
ncbi:exotoxin beta-grasp domain-containing protein, partial [Staphylococcus aureus]|uniref:exotoxin beta-grasp domain-containing protein n=1 Tax=Staphylococcus aureus TaxID=1280 RepID=UPI0037DA5249